MEHALLQNRRLRFLTVALQVDPRGGIFKYRNVILIKYPFSKAFCWATPELT